MKTRLSLAFSLVMLLILTACSPAQATASPTLPPPTATPTPAIKLATSADEIIGTWHAGDNYIRFDTDGTVRQAKGADKLDSDPYSINSFNFEGTQLTITQIKASGVPDCGTAAGSYQIQLLENGSIRIVLTKDLCSARATDIRGDYKPVP